MNLFSLGTHARAFAVGAVLAVAGFLLYGQLGGDGPVRPSAESGVSADSNVVTVYKSPSCTCCSRWVDHLRNNGFEVDVHDRDDLASVKNDLGVPPGLRSCHTAVVGSYVVEGHVPARDIRRMLTSDSEIAGVAVPGMPIGSPGMERGSQVEPYSVLAFNEEGRSQVVARYGSD